MALLITGVTISLCLFCGTAWAFVAGDKVRISLNPKLGPFTIEKCSEESSQKICKLKEAGYFVNTTLLKKYDPKNFQVSGVNDESGAAVGVQVMGR